MLSTNSNGKVSATDENVRYTYTMTYTYEYISIIIIIIIITGTRTYIYRIQMTTPYLRTPSEPMGFVKIRFGHEKITVVIRTV